MTVSTIGVNVSAQYDAKTGKLVLEIDTRAKASASKSGKSMLLSTTNGFATVMLDGRSVKVGLNVLA